MTKKSYERCISESVGDRIYPISDYVSKIYDELV